MSEEELNKILAQIESELNGDAEHDADVLDGWGERFRDDPNAKELMEEIAHRLVDIIMEEEGDLPQQIYDDMVETAEDDYKEACELIEEKQYEEALGKLLVLTEVIRHYPLPEGTVWKDFSSYLEGLVYQDYYSEEIGDREVGRHPMHPAHILYTCGSLLIEMDRAEEAQEVLEMLCDLDPVSPKYLYELAEAYKRTGQLQEAYDTSLWALSCAADRTALARGYRDLGYCLTETGEYDDAVMLYLLSQRYQATRQAEAEIIWIQKKNGTTVDGYNEQAITERCQELGIPIGISETVRMNMEFLDMISDLDEEK